MRDTSTVRTGKRNSNFTQLNGELQNTRIENSIYVYNDSILDAAKSKLGEMGFCFLTVGVTTDAPSGFGYCSGFIVHRSDTLSIFLFSYNDARIAVNSYNKGLDKWTGWKIFTGVSA